HCPSRLLVPLSSYLPQHLDFPNALSYHQIATRARGRTDCLSARVFPNNEEMAWPANAAQRAAQKPRPSLPTEPPACTNLSVSSLPDLKSAMHSQRASNWTCADSTAIWTCFTALASASHSPNSATRWMMIGTPRSPGCPSPTHA